MDPYEELLREMLTLERAAEVRRMRVERGYTWRRVGDEVWSLWGTGGGPGGYSIGYAACVVAAEMLGEAPWA